MDDGLSLGTLWEETVAFVRAEAALLLPVAFALFGAPMVVMQFLIPQPLTVDHQIVAGPWMWAAIPYAVCNMTGSVAISALALRPGISVREALALAIRALPVGIGILLFAIAGLLGLSVLVSLAAGIEIALLGRSGPIFTVAILIAFVAIIFVVVRALPVWAVVADGTRAPRAVLRRAFAMTRRAYLRLLLLRIVAWISQSIALLVVLMPIAVLFALVERLAGLPRLGETLSFVAGGAATAAVLMVWTVYVARLYRRLELMSGI